MMQRLGRTPAVALILSTALLCAIGGVVILWGGQISPNADSSQTGAAGYRLSSSDVFDPDLIHPTKRQPDHGSREPLFQEGFDRRSTLYSADRLLERSEGASCGKADNDTPFILTTGASRAGILERGKLEAEGRRIVLGRAAWEKKCLNENGALISRLEATVEIADVPPITFSLDYVTRDAAPFVERISATTPKPDRARLLAGAPEFRKNDFMTGRAVQGRVAQSGDSVIVTRNDSPLWQFVTSAVITESQWADIGVRIGGKDYTLTVELPKLRSPS